VTEQDLLDRAQITEVLYRYARAIDAKDYALFGDIFAEDAVIHYDLEGGVKLPVGEMADWLSETLQMFFATQHVITNPVIEIDGDSARSTCYLNASHEQVGLDGRRTVFVDHGIYTDRWVRGPVGWRIRRRTLNRLMMHGDFQMPDDCQKFPGPPHPAVTGRGGQDD